jgi:hypothetical protein
VPAGTWTLVGDGVITSSVDVDFEILWRRDGVDDVEIVSWSHHFDPKPPNPEPDFSATAYEVTGEGPAIDFEPGDQLVLRYTGTGTTVAMAYVPNGEGADTGGRHPYIDLPQ